MTDFEQTIREIRANRMTYVDVESLDLGGDKVTALAQALAENQSVRYLTLSKCNIGDEGALALADALRANRNLSTLNLGHNNIGDEGALALVGAIGPSMRELLLSYNPVSAQAAAQMEHVLKATRNKTMFFMETDHTPESTHDWCQGHKIKATQIAEKLQKKEVISLEEWQEAWERREAVENFRQSKLFKDSHFNPDISITPDDLFSSGDGQKPLLDKPQMWQHFAVICKKLETEGNPLLPEHLEQKSPRWGKTFLECGLICAPEQVIPFLNRHGITLQENSLLDKNGEPNAQLQGFASRLKIHSLFTRENWPGEHGMQQMKAFHAKLPQPAQEQVTNLHALSAALRQQRQQSAGLDR